MLRSRITHLFSVSLQNPLLISYLLFAKYETHSDLDDDPPRCYLCQMALFPGGGCRASRALPEEEPNRLIRTACEMYANFAAM